MLVQDVVGHREEIGLWASNRLMARHAQEAQIDFLHEVGNVSACVAQPRRKESTQPLAVVAHQGGYEGLLIVRGQCGAVQKPTIPYLLDGFWGTNGYRAGPVIRGRESGPSEIV